MDDLLIIEEKIDLEVRSLETCVYDHKTFSEILNRVQKAVDDLNLHSYSNLPIWVNKLDMEVRAVGGWDWVLLGMHQAVTRSISLRNGSVWLEHTSVIPAIQEAEVGGLQV